MHSTFQWTVTSSVGGKEQGKRQLPVLTPWSLDCSHGGVFLNSKAPGTAKEVLASLMVSSQLFGELFLKAKPRTHFFQPFEFCRFSVETL